MSSNAKKKWKQKEIDFLKNEFKKGTKIKIIAAMLGKSETAVNKFLTRCGIRPKRHSNNILIENIFDLMPSNLNNKYIKDTQMYLKTIQNDANAQQFITENKPHNLVNNKKREYNNTNPRWTVLLNDIVDFEEVINYLKSKNYKISNIVSENIKLFYPNSEYMLNGHPVSKTKLLILANKLRNEENKALFKLEPII